MDEKTSCQVAQAPQPGALVYVLRAPSDDEVRYVGQTADARKRLSAHLRTGRHHLACLRQRQASPQLLLQFLEQPRGESHNVAPTENPLSLPEWLAGLNAVGMRPQMQIIEIVDCKATCACARVSQCGRAVAREAYWILWYLRAGHRVLNRTVPEHAEPGGAAGGAQ
jgi:hypothetical protein